MPPVKRSRSRTTARSRASKEPAALRRLNKSLDSAQDALTALRKEVGKDVGTGARDLHKNLQRFVKDARRDSGKLGNALQRDIERMQKRLGGPSSGRASRPKASARSTAKKTTARRTSSARSRRR